MMSNQTTGPLVRKPVMYIYNMSGAVISMTVDFKTNVVVDAVPALRKDNKVMFNLDGDSYINSKYDYLYYEFEITKDIPRATYYAYIRNDFNLLEDLLKLANMSGLFGREASDFATYWNLELKRDACKYYKVEIYDEDKLDKLFPIDVFPQPGFFLRRYFKFTPCDKTSKSNIELLKSKYRSRTGNIRIAEWGGWISEAKTIK
jgi:hypothetical protein